MAGAGLQHKLNQKYGEFGKGAGPHGGDGVGEMSGKGWAEVGLQLEFHQTR